MHRSKVSLYFAASVTFWSLCLAYGYYFNNTTTLPQQRDINFSDSALLFNRNTATTATAQNLVLATTAELDYCQIAANANYAVLRPWQLDALITKSHKLPANFVPADLVTLNSAAYPVTGVQKLRREAADALLVMVVDLNNQGMQVRISSGYRSAAAQNRALASWKQRVSEEEAYNYAAVPGYSEHQLGTAVDILAKDNQYQANANMGKTATGIWLAQNAHKYGFVISYPEGKKAITGYNYEPWHFRYVGVSAATQIVAQQTTPTEYFAIYSSKCD